MPYIDRNGQGAVSALFTRPQRPDQEFLAADHAEVIEFKSTVPNDATRLSRLAFLNLFTVEEQVAISLSVDPEVAMLRLQAQMADWIDLNDLPPLLAVLVAKGLLTQERADIIAGG
jgi:hypothetical protein